MGKRGPIPKPTALKLIEGRPGHHPVNKLEPKFQSEIPARPAGMSRAAVKVWREYVDRLNAAGVLTGIDGHGLAALCEDQALLKELRHGWRSLVAEMRRTMRANKKKEIVNPSSVMSRTQEGRRQLASMGSLSSQILAREREFGLLPGSRSRVEANPSGGGKRLPASIVEALYGD